MPHRCAPSKPDPFGCPLCCNRIARLSRCARTDPHQMARALTPAPSWRSRSRVWMRPSIRQAPSPSACKSLTNSVSPSSNLNQKQLRFHRSRFRLHSEFATSKLWSVLAQSPQDLLQVLLLERLAAAERAESPLRLSCCNPKGTTHPPESLRTSVFAMLTLSPESSSFNRVKPEKWQKD